MSTHTRVLWVLLFVIILGVIGTACAAPAPSPATPTAAPAASTQAPAATEAPAAAQEQVELTIWTRFPEIEKLLKELGDKYSEAHPNVKVTVTLFAQRALDEKLAIALPAGSASDIIEIDTISMRIYHQQGLLEPVPAELATFYNEHLTPSAVQSATDEEGNMYASPYFIGIQEMFYNKDFFEEAGLECCPETTEELVAYAKKLTKYDANGNITRAGLDLRLGGGGYGVAEKYWAVAMVPFGAAPVEQVDGGWRAGYDGERGEKALQFYLDALYTHKYDSPEVKSDAEGFGLGLSAMFQRESWVIGYMAENAPDVNYGTFLMPKGPTDWGTVGSATAA